METAGFAIEICKNIVYTETMEMLESFPELNSPVLPDKSQQEETQ